jgi:septal ring factor EnvC (AmiA/AmiB activator)
MINKNQISLILNVVLIGVVIFFLFFNNTESNVNIDIYNQKIDSLSNVITENNKKLDSLSIVENKQMDNIKNLKNELSQVSNKNKELKRKYEKESARYNSMSNNDITDLFSESFK